MVEDNLPLLALPEDNSDRKLLAQQQQQDNTLAGCRGDTDEGENGYSLEEGPLVHKVDDVLGQPVMQVVLPQPRKMNLLELACLVGI